LLANKAGVVINRIRKLHKAVAILSLYTLAMKQWQMMAELIEIMNRNRRCQEKMALEGSV
jgi:hypothetical protein